METALKGFLTLVHKYIYPFFPPLPPFPLPSSSSIYFPQLPQAQKVNLVVWGHPCIVLCWGLVSVQYVHVHPSLSVCWQPNLGELQLPYWLMAFLLRVSGTCRFSTSWFKSCIVVVVSSGSLLHVWWHMQTFVHCSHSLITYDAVLTMLCQYLQGRRDSVCDLDVMTVLFVFGRLLGENPIVWYDWKDDLFWCFLLSPVF